MIIIHIIIYIILASSITYNTDSINKQEQTIEDIEMGKYSDQATRNYNISDINETISNHKRNIEIFTLFLWISLIISIIGVIFIIYGISIKPNYKDGIDLLKIIGIISIIIGVIMLPLGFLTILPKTPFGHNEDISGNAIRISNDFFTFGIILLSVGICFIFTYYKLPKFDNKNSTDHNQILY